MLSSRIRSSSRFFAFQHNLILNFSYFKNLFLIFIRFHRSANTIINQTDLTKPSVTLNWSRTVWFVYHKSVDKLIFNFDFQNRRVRFVGDPVQRIQEDYLRILRYFRSGVHFFLHPLFENSLILSHLWKLYFSLPEKSFVPQLPSCKLFSFPPPLKFKNSEENDTYTISRFYGRISESPENHEEVTLNAIRENVKGDKLENSLLNR